jgi:hypothetical protein
MISQDNSWQATGPQAGQLRNCGPTSGGERDLSLPQSVHSSFGAHLTSYLVGTRGAYRRRSVVGYELNDSPRSVFMVYGDSQVVQVHS